jgi:transcriptional regulator with XRE-family HTH domain
MPSRNLTQPTFFRKEPVRASEEYRRTALAGFLRTRRARIDPDPCWPVVDAGTPRRVPGLRREELAWAAGVSTEYYTKLEQGRAAHPSASVVSSLSEVLQLSELESRYIQALATPGPEQGAEEDTATVTHAEHILRGLGNQLRDPVMLHVLTEDLTIRGVAPATAGILFPDGAPDPGHGFDLSLLTYIFTDPQSRQVYVDWSDKAREVVGLTHLALARSIPTPQLLEALRTAWDNSSAFRYLWSRYEPYGKAYGSWRLQVEGRGIVVCNYTTFQVPSSRNVSLVVYTEAETG